MTNIEYLDNNKKNGRVAMKVALLGATGFVGSALLKESLDRGPRSAFQLYEPDGPAVKRPGIIARHTS